MPVVSELIRIEDDGTISFGNYMLAAKSKLQDFEFQGDLYKVKTFGEITKLERNGMFVYESVPGTAVNHFQAGDTSVQFSVEGEKDAQITIQLEDEREYEVYVDGVSVGGMKTPICTCVRLMRCALRSPMFLKPKRRSPIRSRSPSAASFASIFPSISCPSSIRSRGAC